MAGPSLRLRLAAIVDAARDTKILTFESADGRALPAAEPGAHISLQLAEGMERQYSLMDWGDTPRAYRLGVKLEANGRGGSAFMHQLRIGDELPATGPRNHFPLDEAAASTVLIAGGIGFTPVWSMVTRLESLGRPWRLYYACRTEADAMLLADLRNMQSAVLHFDDVAGSPIDLRAIISATGTDTHLYCCGPGTMLDAFEAATSERDPAFVHLERFAPVAAADTHGGYTVVLARSGREMLVEPGQTILDRLMAAGLNVPNSCREGVCGACETRVIAGEPDHCDSVLTRRERAANKSMMICCSGAHSDRLVLDL